MKNKGEIWILENEVLEFEKSVITESEMAEHVNYYYRKANEGMNILQGGDKPQAMKILRELNRTLEKEYKHYNFKRVEEVIDRYPAASAYKSAITKAYVKQSGKTAYDMLNSNLYDISDYMLINCEDYILGK